MGAIYSSEKYFAFVTEDSESIILQELDRNESPAWNQWSPPDSMVDGLAPNVAYLPVAALAALTAALVTLVLAVSAWKKASGENLEPEQSSESRRSSSGEERPPICENGQLSEARRSSELLVQLNGCNVAGSKPTLARSGDCSVSSEDTSRTRGLPGEVSSSAVGNGVRHRVGTGPKPDQYYEFFANRPAANLPNGCGKQVAQPKTLDLNIENTSDSIGSSTEKIFLDPSKEAEVDNRIGQLASESPAFEPEARETLVSDSPDVCSSDICQNNEPDGSKKEDCLPAALLDSQEREASTTSSLSETERNEAVFTQLSRDSDSVIASQERIVRDSTSLLQESSSSSSTEKPTCDVDYDALDHIKEATSFDLENTDENSTLPTTDLRLTTGGSQESDIPGIEPSNSRDSLHDTEDSAICGTERMRDINEVTANGTEFESSDYPSTLPPECSSYNQVHSDKVTEKKPGDFTSRSAHNQITSPISERQVGNNNSLRENLERIDKEGLADIENSIKNASETVFFRYACPEYAKNIPVVSIGQDDFPISERIAVIDPLRDNNDLGEEANVVNGTTPCDPEAQRKEEEEEERIDKKQNLSNSNSVIFGDNDEKYLDSREINGSEFLSRNLDVESGNGGGPKKTFFEPLKERMHCEMSVRIVRQREADVEVSETASDGSVRNDLSSGKERAGVLEHDENENMQSEVTSRPEAQQVSGRADSICHANATDVTERGRRLSKSEPECSRESNANENVRGEVRQILSDDVSTTTQVRISNSGLMRTSKGMSETAVTLVADSNVQDSVHQNCVTGVASNSEAVTGVDGENNCRRLHENGDTSNKESGAEGGGGALPFLHEGRETVKVNTNTCGDVDSVCNWLLETLEETPSKPNNGHCKDGFSCLPPPRDVMTVTEEEAGREPPPPSSSAAASEAAVKQDGKARTVQGSRRDHLIGKAPNSGVTPNFKSDDCGGGGEGDGVTVSPAKLCYASESPPQLQMSDSGDSRCDVHDPTRATIPYRPGRSAADGLERLDALVELLNDLASDDREVYSVKSSGNSSSADGTVYEQLSSSSGGAKCEGQDATRSPRGTNSPASSPCHRIQGYSSSRYYYECDKRDIIISDVSERTAVSSASQDHLTTHSSYNADVSNNCLPSDESTSGYPAESSVFISSEPQGLTTTCCDTLLDGELTDVSSFTRSSWFEPGYDSSERTEVLSIDESLSSAISPTENVNLLPEFSSYAKHPDGCVALNHSFSKAAITSDNTEETADSARTSSTCATPGREAVLQNLRALTLKLRTPNRNTERSNSGEIQEIGETTSSAVGDCDNPISVDESVNLSSPWSEDVDFPGNIPEMYESEIDSPRRQKLLKLLERDKERQLRLQQLSDANQGRKLSPSNENDDPRKTLQDLECAIGHMQKLIGQKDDQFRRFQPADVNENELHFSTMEERRTIDTGRHKEAGHHDPAIGDLLDGPNHHVNLLNNDASETLSNCCRSSADSFVGQVLVKNSQEFKTDRESYSCSTEISIESPEVRDNVDIIYDSGLSLRCGATSIQFEEKYTEKTEEIGARDFVSRTINDRWQCPSARDFSQLQYDSDLKWNSNENRLQQDQGERGKRREREVAESPRNVYEGRFGASERGGKKKTLDSESAAKGRWRSGGASDVSDSFAQSQPRSRSAERAAISPLSFSDDLAQSAKSTMQSIGECDMEDSPPPALQPCNESAIKNGTSTTPNSAAKTPTPTKIKNLRFKLDPDIFDLPSENGYEDDVYNRRPNWKKQTKYNTFSSLDLGRSKEPVQVVSVRTSVVPGGQKMVVKPVCVSEGQKTTNGRVDDSRITVKHLDIDLRIRLETENGDKNGGQIIVYDSKKDNVTSSSPDVHAKKNYLSSNVVPPAQTKRRSPAPEYSCWNQSLSPVSENCDFMPSSNGTGSQSSFDSGERNVRWSPESSFRSSDGSRDESFSSAECENHYANGHDKRDATSSEEEPIPFKSSPDENGDVRKDSGPLTSTPSRPSSLSLNKYRKYVQLPRKKFVPDPDAIERITGFKAAEEKSQTKPPLPPVIRSLSSNRIGSNSKTRIEQLRKRYLDTKSLMAAHRADGGSKFEEFLNRAQEDRAKLITSTPDLAAFEAAVRSQWSKARKQNENNSGKENAPPSHQQHPAEMNDADSGRCDTPDDVWLSYVQSLRRQLNRRSQSLSYLETDIDAFLADDKCRSMTMLEKSPTNSTQSLAISGTKEHRVGLPIEESGRTKSEHELRIERSLQNLTVPEWYKHSQRPKAGFILDKKSDEKKGWAAAKSLTGSTSSLSSSGTKPKRPARSLRSSRENLLWSRGSSSPASADNSYNRWGRTNSGPVLSLAVAKAFREPYLGWRTRTPSSCASPSPQPDFSPPSWVVMDNNTDRSDTPLTSDLQAMDEEDDDTGFSFEGEDVLETANTSSLLQGKIRNAESPPLHSADDTCEDVINISMDTCDVPQMVNGHSDGSKTQDLHNEDTCDDIKNITMDTFELIPPSPAEEPKQSPIGDDTSDDILNISTDTSSHLNQGYNETHQDNQVSHSVVGANENTGDGVDNISTDASYAHLSSSYHPPPPPTPPLDTAMNGSRSGSTSPMQQDCSSSDSQVVVELLSEPRPNKDSCKELRERSKFDPKRKRYSYHRSIYQNELDGVKSKGQEEGDPAPPRPHSQGLQDGGSTRSLPGGNNDGKAAGNNVIWIESSFVGSRTTTSIMVMPPERKHKGSNGCCRGGSTGSSNSSVGRPASR